MQVTAHDVRFWDRIARKYATDAIADLEGYERTLERTRQLLRATDTVLEIGCGTGTSALRLAPAVGRIVGSDVSSEMIAIARERAAAQAASNAAFVVAPADAAPGVAGSFDAVLAFNLLHLIGDRPAALRHAYNLMKPGGLLITKTPCLSEMTMLVRAALRLAIPPMRVAGRAPNVSFFSAGSLEHDMTSAGFTIVERAHHGTKRKDVRAFLVARKAD